MRSSNPQILCTAHQMEAEDEMREMLKKKHKRFNIFAREFQCKVEEKHRKKGEKMIEIKFVIKIIEEKIICKY